MKFFKANHELALYIILLSLLFCSNPLAAKEKHLIKIVSLAPSTTEMLFALGLDEEIVGVSTFCNYPAKALRKDKVGSFSNPNIEKILLLKPDLIFATGLEQSMYVSRLRKMGFKIFVSYPKDINGLFRDINEIGRLTNRQHRAKVLVSQMQQKVQDLKYKAEMVKNRPRVYIEIWHDPLITVGRDSFLNDLVRIAGGENVASKTKGSFIYISPEWVIQSRPEVIILCYGIRNIGARSQLERRPVWNQLPAVKNNRVYADIDADILLRPGPRAIEAAEKLFNSFYNEHTQD